MNRCQCREPATRLIRVVYKDPARRNPPDAPYEQNLGPASMDRSTTFACCEIHRHSAQKILRKWWKDEIRAGEVTVLMGKKRRPGA